MLTLVETSQGLALSYPAWFGVVLLVMGVALGAYVARGKAQAKMRFSYFLLTLALAGGGLFVLTLKVTLTDEGGRNYAFLVKDERIEWKDAASLRLERREVKGGIAWHIIVLDHSGREFDIATRGLSDGERNVVVKFITAKVR